MASVIPSYYTNLAAMDMTVKKNKVQVQNYTELKGSTSTTPIRILIPFSAGDKSARMINVARNALTVRWRVVDLLLLRSVPQGTSLGAAAEDVVQYEMDYYANYLSSFSKISALPLVSLAVSEGVIEYPAESGEWYIFVEFQHEITENLG